MSKVDPSQIFCINKACGGITGNISVRIIDNIASFSHLAFPVSNVMSDRILSK